MNTNKVRALLVRDYGIVDVPNELLCHWVQRAMAQYAHAPSAATIAFMVANRWQKGKESVA